MSNLPCFFLPEPEESIHSYLENLALSNGVADLNLFIDSFIDGNAFLHKKITAGLDIPYILPRLAEKESFSLKQFVQNQSIFPIIWPFMTKRLQGYYVESAFHSNPYEQKSRYGNRLTTPRYLTNKKWCPKCRSEHHPRYISRLQLFSGTKYCPIHNCPLETKAGELSVTPADIRFAHFIGSSDRWVNCSGEQLDAIVKAKLNQTDINDLAEQLVKESWHYQSRELAERYLERLKKNFLINPQSYIGLCSFLFDDIPTLLDLAGDSPTGFTPPSDYTILEDWNCGIYKVSSNDGYSFLTTKGYLCREFEKSLDFMKQFIK